MTLDEFDRTDYAQMLEDALKTMEFISSIDHLDGQGIPVFNPPHISMGIDLYYLAVHVASINEPFTLPSGRKFVYNAYKVLTYLGRN